MFYYKDRDLRNFLEHYSTELISVIATSGNMSSFRVCNSSGVDKLANNTTKEQYMRTFVTDTKTYIFRGKEFDIAQMEKEIEELLSHINENHSFKEML